MANETSNPTAPIITASGLHKAYRRGNDRVDAVRGAGLVVAPGEMIAIIGPSGGGKTTFLNLLGGLDRADSGILEVAGVDLMAASESGMDRFRRDHVGFVFQFFNLIGAASALDNVAFALLAQGERWRTARSRSAAVLADLGLSHRAQHLPSELSGGEQQRVAIARAVAGAPDVILADEPTGDVDSEASGDIMRLLADLNRDRGVTVVIVTHDLGVAAQTDRVLTMLDGFLEESPA